MRAPALARPSRLLADTRQVWVTRRHVGKKNGEGLSVCQKSGDFLPNTRKVIFVVGALTFLFESPGQHCQTLAIGVGTSAEDAPKLSMFRLTWSRSIRVCLGSRQSQMIHVVICTTNGAPKSGFIGTPSQFLG